MKALSRAQLRIAPESRPPAVYERFESRYKLNPVGGVTERSNVPVLKTGVGETPPWVRIPPPPPRIFYAHFSSAALGDLGRCISLIFDILVDLRISSMALIPVIGWHEICYIHDAA